MANKAELDGYSEEPFFKIDKDYEIQRLVAWAGGAEPQEQLFWALAEVCGERIEYLLKEEVDLDSDGLLWKRVSGGILFDDLKSAVATDSDLFFHDSGFQICLRIPDSGDYFAYDEHGIFWIYSEDKRFRKKLEVAGLTERDAPLICDSGHWHVRPKDAEPRLERFIETLVARSKFHDRETS